MQQNNDVTKGRFSEADWFLEGVQDIIIGGTGGIGSWTALALSRIGHNLYLYDADLVEEVNLAGQFYKRSNIGKSKSQATKDNILECCNNDIQANGWFTEDSLVTPIMISAFDNMKARKLMFEKWAEQEDRELFIDGRMLLQEGMVFAVTKGQEDLYRSELFDDNEIADLPCNYKATTHCGMIIGGLITSLLNNYLSNKRNNMEINVLQFKTVFNLCMMSFEEEIVEINKEECIDLK
jgi:hypothetical protein